MHPNGGMNMSTIPIHYHEVIRFYQRLNKLKPVSITEKTRLNNSDSLSISSEAKKRLVMEQARSEVFEKIKR